MNIDKHFKRASDIADRSPMKRFNVGALIVRRNKIISSGWSHVSGLKLREYISIHAELHALWRCNPDEIEDSSVFVVAKSAKNGNWTVGKPCECCMAHLYDAGVRNIFFSTGVGSYGHYDLRDGKPALLIRTRGQEDWDD